MGKLAYHVRAVRAAAHVHQHRALGVQQRLYDAGGHRRSIKVLALEVEDDAFPLQIVLAVARAEQRLGLIHVEKVYLPDAFARKAESQVDGRLGFS